MIETAAVRDALFDVRIRAIASNGSGVADLPDGRVVFVPRTAPGDHARVRLGKVKRKWAQASLVELLEHASNRIDAPCRLFDVCGGCSLQHLPYDAHLEWKGRFVSDAMTRIGGVRVDPPEVLPSPKPYGYRNRVSYSMRRLRGGRVVAGFHALGRPAHVIEVESECLLPEPVLRTAWSELRAHWGSGARRLPSGGNLRLTLRCAGDLVALEVDGGGADWDAGELAEALPSLVAVWHRPSGAKRATLVSHPRDDSGLSPAETAVLGGAFLQVNAAVAEALLEYVLERSRFPHADSTHTNNRVVDAYCGVGVYARGLADRGSEVTGIEVDPDACAAARRDAPATLSVVQGLVEEHLAASLPTDLLILNPPRTGLHDSVPDIVRAAPPARVIYVSCDPATLARDVSRLSGSHALQELRAFDLFPQTTHVETVAVLARVEGET